MTTDKDTHHTPSHHPEQQPDNEWPDAAKVDVPHPLRIHMTPQGCIEVLCYQKIIGEMNAMPMRLSFDGPATQQLLGTLIHAVQQGQITLEQGYELPGLQ